MVDFSKGRGVVKCFAKPIIFIFPPSLQILYTMRGVDNLEKSRSYFSQALRLDNNNMRALYGFFMVRKRDATFRAPLTPKTILRASFASF